MLKLSRSPPDSGRGPRPFSQDSLENQILVSLVLTVGEPGSGRGRGRVLIRIRMHFMSICPSLRSRLILRPDSGPVIARALVLTHQRGIFPGDRLPRRAYFQFLAPAAIRHGDDVILATVNGLLGRGLVPLVVAEVIGAVPRVPVVGVGRPPEPLAATTDLLAAEPGGPGHDWRLSAITFGSARRSSSCWRAAASINRRLQHYAAPRSEAGARSCPR